MTTRNTGLIAVLIFCFALLTSAKVFAQSDMEAKNTALMKRFYDEAVNQDKMELFDEFFSKDFVEHEDLGNLPSNKEGVKKFFAMQRQAFPYFITTCCNFIYCKFKIRESLALHSEEFLDTLFV